MINAFSRGSLSLVATAVGAALAFAPSALGQGATVELANGSTQLSINSSSANFLANNGIGVSSIRPATASGQRFNFPVTGGDINPVNGVGVIDHGGGLAIQSADSPKTLRLRNFIANTNNRTLTAQVGSTGNRVAFGRIGLANAKVIRRAPGGVGTYIVRASLAITPAGARAINQFFGRDLPLAGVVLGRIDIRTTPAEVLLARSARNVDDLNAAGTTLNPTGGVIGTLAGLGASPGPIDPAALIDGVFRFPIDGGQWVLEAPLGNIQHSGGVSLSGSGNSPQVNLTNFDINSDADTGPRVLAQVNGGRPTQVLNLDLSNAKVGLSNGFLVINNAVGSFSATSAAAINQAFNANAANAIPDGLTLGTFRVKADVI